jgi:MFS family permease
MALNRESGALASADAKGGVTAWYSELSSVEKRTIWACWAGWVLDAMDLMIYSMVMPTLIALWHMTNAQAGTLATAALLSSAIGGWVTGMLCDRIGRVRMLQICILWFAVFTALSGLATSPDQLLILRALQGLGFGGEWAAGAVLIGEIIQSKHRGKALGVVQSGFQWGYGLAVLLSTLFFSIMAATMAWRALFFAGLLPALLVFFVRRYVPESPVFEKARGKQVNPFMIFSREHVRTTIITSLFCLGVAGGALAITIWLPTFLKTTRGLSVLGSGGYLAVYLIGAIVGNIVSGYLSDVVGRRNNFAAFAIMSFITVVLFTFLPISDSWMLVLGFPLGFFTQGIFGAIGPFLSEQFPTNIRVTGQGFSYSFGRAVGSFVPTLVGILSASVPLGQAIGIVSLGGYALIIITAYLLPETKGIDLASLDKPPKRA